MHSKSRILKNCGTSKHIQHFPRWLIVITASLVSSCSFYLVPLSFCIYHHCDSCQLITGTPISDSSAAAYIQHHHIARNDEHDQQTLRPLWRQQGCGCGSRDSYQKATTSACTQKEEAEERRAEEREDSSAEQNSYGDRKNAKDRAKTKELEEEVSVVSFSIILSISLLHLHALTIISIHYLLLYNSMR